MMQRITQQKRNPHIIADTTNPAVTSAVNDEEMEPLWRVLAEHTSIRTVDSRYNKNVSIYSTFFV